MKLVVVDIDQLLAATSLNKDEENQFTLREIEIDMLLSVTKDW